MRNTVRFSMIAAVVCCASYLSPQMSAQLSSVPREQAMKSFHWPDGKRAAVSLSFDDARLSQVDTGLGLFRKLGVRVTFFAQSAHIQERLAGWKQAVADKHEIGNRTVTHPCTGTMRFRSRMHWRTTISGRWQNNSMTRTCKSGECWG